MNIVLFHRLVFQLLKISILSIKKSAGFFKSVKKTIVNIVSKKEKQVNQEVEEEDDLYSMFDKSASADDQVANSTSKVSQDSNIESKLKEGNTPQANVNRKTKMSEQTESTERKNTKEESKSINNSSNSSGSGTDQEASENDSSQDVAGAVKNKTKR